MLITSQKLKELNACSSGHKWFVDHFPSEVGSYQEILDALCYDDKYAYAVWLFNKFGYDPSSAIELDALNRSGAFIVAGDVVVKGDVHVDKHFIAAGDVRVDGDFECGKNADIKRAFLCNGDVRVGSCLSLGGFAIVNGKIETGSHISACDHLEVEKSITSRRSFIDAAGPVVAREIKCLAYFRAADDVTADKIHVTAGYIDVGGDLTVSHITSEGDLKVTSKLETDGCVKVTGNIQCGCIHSTGDSFKTHGGIKTSGDIYAKGDLMACFEIESGRDIIVRRHLLAGEVSSRGAITVDGKIDSTGSIKARSNIHAQAEIIAAENIMAGRIIYSKKFIKAGSEYGIYAGLHVPRSEWAERGFVSTPTKPDNLISGHWIETEPQGE